MALLLAMAPAVGAVEKEDMENLSERMRDIAIYPLVRPFLDLEMRILNKCDITRDETPFRMQSPR